MEEILASIRQIISEDGGAPASTIEAARGTPLTGGEEEMLGRSGTGEEPLGEEPTFGVDGPDRREMERTASYEGDDLPGDEETAFRPRPPAVHSHYVPEDDGPLLSPESGQAISGAFGALAQTILAQNARTLEDVVAEMLQPMLKQWLDDNLPSIVERKVQEEIQRVSRGRR